jgi:hypothetical protein
VRHQHSQSLKSFSGRSSVISRACSNSHKIPKLCTVSHLLTHLSISLTVMSRTNAPEQFTMLGSPHRDNVFGDYEEQYSAKTADPDVGVTASIRHHHPDMTLTVTPTSYIDLLGFAAAGNASAELDTADDSIRRWRFYVSARTRGHPGTLQDVTFFARYKYEWKNLSFILYLCQEGLQKITYILFPPDVSSSKPSQARTHVRPANKQRTTKPSSPTPKPPTRC